MLHELGELVGGVLAAGVPVQQGVEVAQHLRERLLGRRIRQRLGEAAEALVDDLLAQLVEDLLVQRPRLVAGPLVLRELLDRTGGRAGQVVQHGLGEPGGVVVASAELLPLGGDRLVEQLLGPGHRTVELAPPHRLPPHPAGPGQQVVQTAAAVRAAAQQVAQRLAQAAAAPARPAPTASTAARTSYGGASGSGPPCHSPYRLRRTGTHSRLP